MPARRQTISDTAANFKTGNQGVGNVSGGPDLYGTPSGGRRNIHTMASRAAALGTGSGAATSAPFPRTFYAPGNIALMQEGKTTLPQTVLESFVVQSNLSEAIYGFEGYDGPPEFESPG